MLASEADWLILRNTHQPRTHIWKGMLQIPLATEDNSALAILEQGVAHVP